MAESSEAKRSESDFFECTICLESPTDPVVSICGHLFCWPCLHQWLELKPQTQICPTCKSAINRDKVVPIYGRGDAKKEDPRNKIPSRPRGTRSEHSENPRGWYAFGGLGGGFGIGLFPFGYFANLFHIEDVGMQIPTRTDEIFLHNIFLIAAIGSLILLYFA